MGETAEISPKDIAKLTQYSYSAKQVIRMTRRGKVPGRINTGHTHLKYDPENPSLKRWITAHTLPPEERGRRGRKCNRNGISLESAAKEAVKAVQNQSFIEAIRHIDELAVILPRKVYLIKSGISPSNRPKLFQALSRLKEAIKRAIPDKS